MTRIYTKRGDDGTTGLLFGGRVSKDAIGPEAYGSVDEAISAIGLARSHDGDHAPHLLSVQRDLFVVAAELAASPSNRAKLVAGQTRVTPEMVASIEQQIDVLEAEMEVPTEFLVPGQDRLSAAMDHARTVVRRAERRCVTWQAETAAEGSLVVQYLNRLADYLYLLTRSAETEAEPWHLEDE